MRVKETATGLIKKYGTNNPFDIANAEGIIVLRSQLGKIRGYYHEVNRIKLIHINESLDEVESTQVCAHELGHAKLHECRNTPFLLSHTLYPISKYEKEADHFMVQLLYPDADFMEYCNFTVSQIANITGLNEELINYKRKTVIGY